MSYILDALRKADAQRERDPSRGIHAQPVRIAIGERRRDGYRLGFWTASAAGLAALASVAWYLYQDGGTVAVVVPAARTEGVMAAAPSPAVVAAAVEAPAAAVLPPPVVVAPPIVAPPPVVVAPPTARTSRAAAARAAAALEEAPPAAAAPQPAAPPAVAAPQPAAPPAIAEAARAVAGLPPDAPKLAISGGVYSANAAQRMLIVNGQVFNEGGEVGTGVVLEEIKPKAAVLRFRGSRYTVAY